MHCCSHSRLDIWCVKLNLFLQNSTQRFMVTWDYICLRPSDLLRMSGMKVPPCTVLNSDTVCRISSQDQTVLSTELMALHLSLQPQDAAAPLTLIGKLQLIRHWNENVLKFKCNLVNVSTILIIHVIVIIYIYINILKSLKLDKLKFYLVILAREKRTGQIVLLSEFNRPKARFAFRPGVNELSCLLLGGIAFGWAWFLKRPHLLEHMISV